MVVADIAVRKRAPRMLHSQQRDPMPIPSVDECESAAGELACQADRYTFADVERLVELVAHLGLNPQLPTMVVNGQPTAVAQPIDHVLSWCADCPFKRRCYALMTVGTHRYTGIAGGELLHNGKPYRPRAGRVRRRREPVPVSGNRV